jgi:hypothetical protein
MNFYGKTLLGLAMTVALTAPALAGEPTAANGPMINSVVVHSLDGKTTLVPIDAARQAELLASSHAKQLTAGCVVLIANGKTYLIEDHKMPDGEMMIKSILNYAPEGGG